MFGSTATTLQQPSLFGAAPQQPTFGASKR
ncbi:unnamed protein product [Gongylonema pulchrum]|uniref:Uncharacterized protein n=1 Tax=Gongylonema pulchrum TaxID=637853 RepID=A0A3P7NHV1_9BILA|nr:unnamed protein product [Gongylonema pulchrum]